MTLLNIVYINQGFLKIVEIVIYLKDDLFMTYTYMIINCNYNVYYIAYIFLFIDANVHFSCIVRIL